jgi:hypothetical protein
MICDEKHVYQHTTWHRFRLLETSIQSAVELLFSIIGTDHSTIPQFFVSPITVLALDNVSGRAFCGKIWLYFWTQGKETVVHTKRKRVTVSNNPLFTKNKNH